MTAPTPVVAELARRLGEHRREAVDRLAALVAARGGKYAVDLLAEVERLIAAHAAAMAGTASEVQRALLESPRAARALFVDGSRQRRTLGGAFLKLAKIDGMLPAKRRRPRRKRTHGVLLSGGRPATASSRRRAPAPRRQAGPAPRRPSPSRRPARPMPVVEYKRGRGP